MSKKELFKRYVLFIVSLFVSGLGVAFAKHGELGVTPISSAANIMSLKFEFLSIGNWLIIWNCLLIVGQILILRKKFQLIQLLQIPISFLFGWFTDVGVLIVEKIPVESYLMKLAMVIISIIVLGFGISLSVTANVILNSGEAFVKVISDASKKDFGNIKIIFDILCVALAVVLSLIFFNFRMVGTREGTIISAIFTGVAVKFFNKLTKKPINNILIN